MTKQRIIPYARGPSPPGCRCSSAPPDHSCDLTPPGQASPHSKKLLTRLLSKITFQPFTLLIPLKMQNKTAPPLLAKLSSLVLALALTLATPLAALAQANEFTGTVTAPTDGTPGSTSTAVTFTFDTATDALAAGDKIVITVPTDFGNFAAIIAGDVSFTTADTSINNATAETFDTTQRTITYVLGGAESAIATEVVTVTIGATNFLTFPATSGQYALHISTKDSNDVVQETGYAVVSIDNTVSVTAIVTEALILTINDTTLNLNADPSVNSGQDTTQNTILSLASNAYGGFVITASLADTGATANQLLGANNGAALTSADIAGDNYFKFTSTTPAGGDGNLSDGGIVSSITAFAGSTTVYTATGSGGDLVNDGDVTVAYDFNVDYTTPADTYAGTITYTATPTF